ncbi:hypothetical protein Misp06_04011 [Microbulbifer sp. NBRC 101763]|uniref:hypothetical protein n=1 Tax=Microbulbifer sp. NBRC 101763 TaxID=1113820 RepID=UPI00309C7120
MKRYALFCGAYNLMMGGIKDFKQSFHTEEEAQEAAKQVAKNEIFTHWAQIFDKKTDTAKVYSVINGKLKRREDKEKNCPTEIGSASEPNYC